MLLARSPSMKSGVAIAQPADPADSDDVVAIVFKYLAAAREGRACQNLGLMARIMRGQAATRSLYADGFPRFASIIASLNYEEVCTIATIYRVRNELLPKVIGQPFMKYARR